MRGPLEDPLVIKFGGTSVGSGEAFARAASIAAEAARERPVAVVVSAMSGTTDALLRAARRGPGGDAGATSALRDSLAERHLRAAREVVPAERLPRMEARISELLDGLVETLEAPVERGSAEVRRDAVAQFGERLSAEVLAGAIANAGAPAEVVSGDPVATDANPGEAEVDVGGTEERASRYVAPLLLRGTVAVVPGFVGRRPDGEVTTLGRGGSDLSATVIGRSLGAPEVWILSDVDGVLDADPRLVPDAQLMPRLSYREADLFASLGAKVLHPRTMEPARAAGMQVRVRNTFAPERPGTLVSGFEDGPGVRCVALRRLAIEVPCGDGYESASAMVVGIGTPQSGDLARGRRCLREAGVPLLHAGHAAAGLVFVVKGSEGTEALRALHRGLVDRTSVGEEVA